MSDTKDDFSDIKECPVCQELYQRVEGVSEASWTQRKFCSSVCRMEAARQKQQPIRPVVNALEFEDSKTPHLTKKELVKLKQTLLARLSDVDKAAQAVLHKLKATSSMELPQDQMRWVDLTAKLLNAEISLAKTLFTHSIEPHKPVVKQEMKELNSSTLDLLNKAKHPSMKDRN